MTSGRFVAASAVLACALVVTGWTAASAFPLQKSGSEQPATQQDSGVINVSFNGADLPSALRLFSRRFGMPVLVDPQVRGRVNLELRDVPWRTVFDTILRDHYLASRIQGATVVVFPASEQNPPPPPPAPPRDMYRNPPPPPPPPQVVWQSPDAAEAVRVGGQIKQPIKTKDVRPVYPDIARAAHVQGVAIVEALIDRQGNVEEVHVLRSIPLLDQAAVDAVSQWKFTPVLLNGQAIPIIMTATVNFMEATPGQNPPSAQAAWQSPDAADAVRLGGQIKPPTKIQDVRPVYPADAQLNRVQGVVIVEALIDRQGNVEEVHVLRSIPMLDQAAVDAVSQWKFTPVLLNGEPVPVIMTTTVNFRLQ